MFWWSILISLMGCVLAPSLTLTETKFLPRSEEEYKTLTKDFNCPDKTFPTYVTSSKAKKTYIVCWKKILIFGFCLEFNEGGQTVQAIVVEDCTKFLFSRCKLPYNSTESYKIFECFEKHGGMLSPKQQTELIQNRELNETVEAAKQEARKHKDCKEDLENTRIQRNGGFGAFSGAVVCSFVAFGFYIKRRKLIQLWTRLRNSVVNCLGIKNIDISNKENSAEDRVKTENETDNKTDDTFMEELNELDNLVNKSESNDCKPVSEAIPISEENNAYTVEMRNISPFIDMGKHSSIRSADIDRGFAKQ